jgi:adenylate cyclase
MKKFVALLLVLFAALSCFAQGTPEEQVQVDSLRKVIASASSDTTRILAIKKLDDIIWLQDPALNEALNRRIDSMCDIHLATSITPKEKRFYLEQKAYALNIFGMFYQNRGESEQALEYYNKSLTIKQGLNDLRGVAKSLNNISIFFYRRGEIDTAIYLMHKTLDIWTALKDQVGIASSFNLIGVSLLEQGNYAEAIQYYDRSLRVMEKLDDKRGISTVLTNIARMQATYGEYEKALANYNKCLEYRLEMGDKKAIAASYQSIANSYGRLGNYDEKLNYEEKALAIFIELNYNADVAETLWYLGGTHQSLGDQETALKCYQQSLTMSEEIGIPVNTGNCNLEIGAIHFRNGDLETAFSFINRAYQLGLSINDIQLIKNSSGNLWHVQKALGNTEAAVELLELYMNLKDSLGSEENKKQVIRQQFKYDYDTKAEQDSIVGAEKDLRHSIETDRQNQQKNFLYSGLALALLFGGFIYNRFRVTRKQKNIIALEKQNVEVQKARSEELLLNILPAEIAEELKSKGSAEAQLIDFATVLFTDFKGFTALSELLSPQDLVKEINVCFSAFDHIMSKYGIEKIKTIGDAYMAAGGLPTPNQTHPLDVVKAAIEIQQFMLDLAEQKKAKNEPYFEIRIGVHTGPVVAGIVGVKKFQYDIWGDTVNTASRMESSGAVGMVNISEATYELIKDHKEYSFESRGKVEAKGKGIQEMFFVSLT